MLPASSSFQLESPRFQTLDWLPLRMLYGDTLPELGYNTDFPAETTDAQTARIYWNPQRFAIVLATIETREYGPLSIDVPILSDFRTDPANGGTATKCHQLLRGIGGSVSASQEFTPTSGTHAGTPVTVAAEFTLYSVCAMYVEGFWLKMFASVSVTPFDTNPSGYAATKIITNFREIGNAGIVNILQEKGKDLGATATLQYVIPLVDNGPDCHDVRASLSIDYAPWIFSD